VLAVVWQFDVQDGSEDAFEKLHGADGAWTAPRGAAARSRSSFLKELATPGAICCSVSERDDGLREASRDFGPRRRAEGAAHGDGQGDLRSVSSTRWTSEHGTTWSVRDGR
jgi:hypothetical protein